MKLSPAACYSWLTVKAIFSIVLLFVIMTIVLWLEKLRKSKECDCSKDWKRTYILGFLSFLFVWNLLFGSYTLYRSFVNKCNDPKILAPGLLVAGVLLFAGMILYIATSYMYAKKLQESSCACAMKDKGYQFMRIYTILITAILLTPILLPILLLLITAIFLVVRKAFSKK